MTVKTFQVLVSCCVAAVVAEMPSKPLRLWPGIAPGDKPGEVGPEGWEPSHGDDVNRLTNVTVPMMEFFEPSTRSSFLAAVLVCPGGGYMGLSMNSEGSEVAMWLNSMGISAAVLKYRVPKREGREMWDAPLQDAQRALGLMRFNANEWGIDPDRIGICGFSAGGHLTATVSTNYATRTYPRVDAADDVSCRPDFSIPVYPWKLVEDDNPRKLTRPINITSDTPPACGIQAEDDPVAHVENTVEYFLGLKDAGVLAEAHLFPRGGHGYGLRKSQYEVCTWPERAAQWMEARGFV